VWFCIKTSVLLPIGITAELRKTQLSCARLAQSHIRRGLVRCPLLHGDVAVLWREHLSIRPDAHTRARTATGRRSLDLALADRLQRLDQHCVRLDAPLRRRPCHRLGGGSNRPSRTDCRRPPPPTCRRRRLAVRALEAANLSLSARHTSRSPPSLQSRLISPPQPRLASLDLDPRHSRSTLSRPPPCRAPP